MLDVQYIELIKEKLEKVEDLELKQLIMMLINDNLNLQKESTIDPLTGLYNRRILEQLKKLPTIAIMCDIDNFKVINDTLGHDKGDYVINRVGTILRKNFRSSDYVCRLGGDEFLILISDYSNREFVLERCEKIKCEISDTIVLPNSKVTISMGIAIDNNCNSLDEIIKKADESLYLAKNSGKNQVAQSDELSNYHIR